MTLRIGITPGEPAGIGPDLVVQLAQQSWPVELVVCADPKVLQQRAAQLGLPLTLLPYQQEQPAKPQASRYFNHRSLCSTSSGSAWHY